MIAATILGKILSGNKRSSARGAPVAMAKKTRDSRKNQSMLSDLRSRNERSNNASANRPRGRTQAGRDSAAAAAAAAKLAAEKAAGQKRRKAFYKAKTTLLFNKDKKA